MRYVARGRNRYTGHTYYLSRANAYNTETDLLRAAKTFTSPEAAIAGYRAARGAHVEPSSIEAMAVERGRDGGWQLAGD